MRAGATESWGDIRIVECLSKNVLVLFVLSYVSSMTRYSAEATMIGLSVCLRVRICRCQMLCKKATAKRSEKLSYKS